jgi:hypothetical protein
MRALLRVVISPLFVGVGVSGGRSTTESGRAHWPPTVTKPPRTAHTQPEVCRGTPGDPYI